LVAAFGPDAPHFVALEGVMPTTLGSLACGGDGPIWSQLVFPKMFFRNRWNHIDHRKFGKKAAVDRAARG